MDIQTATSKLLKWYFNKYKSYNDPKFAANCAVQDILNMYKHLDRKAMLYALCAELRDRGIK